MAGPVAATRSSGWEPNSSLIGPMPFSTMGLVVPSRPAWEAAQAFGFCWRHRPDTRAAAGAGAREGAGGVVPGGDGDDLEGVGGGGGVAGGGTKVFCGFGGNSGRAGNPGRLLAGMVLQACGLDEGVDFVETGVDCGIALGRRRDGWPGMARGIGHPDQFSGEGMILF